MIFGQCYSDHKTLNVNFNPDKLNEGKHVYNIIEETVEVDKDEVVVVVEMVDYFVTVQTTSGEIGWQSAVHFKLLQKWNK